VLKVTNVTQTYKSGNKSLTVLDSINFSIEKGSITAIVGPSGSGKTTLLGLCAGLDRASSGEIELAGTPMSNLSEDQRAKLRSEHVGFVFQSFQLIPTLTALENVLVPIEIKGIKNGGNQAKALLERVGLGDRTHHYPTQLSGGEQQRVAIARAFINQPKILFADEPTGNLDNATGNSIEDLIFSLNKDIGTTLVLVTHDLDLAKRANRIIRLHAGKIVEDTINV
jgi:putative ABC transport system ATP-binding protein